METRTVEVSSRDAGGLDGAIKEQVAAITARGGTVIRVQLISPLAARIAYTGGTPTD